MVGSSIQSLAALGGRPLFRTPRLIGTPNLGDRDRFFEIANEVFDRAWLTNDGPVMQRFEKSLREFFGVKHCVPVSNATVGLEMTLRAMKVKGEVIVPSYTFVASANVIMLAGAKPVFCDVDAATHLLDPAAVERCITPATTAILAVHLWGNACEVDALQEIADRHGLKLIYDAAHAFGSSLNGKRIGGFGDAEVFSFHATKVFNTFEGGVITTNDDALAAELRAMRNFGFTKDEDVSVIGTNAKMSEMSAAMGLALLPEYDSIAATNRSVYEAYCEELRDVKGLRIYEFGEGVESNHHYIPMEITPEFGMGRDRLLEILRAEHVMARRYFYPGCHRMSVYAAMQGRKKLRLPETEKLSSTVLALPMAPAVSVEEAREIAGLVRFIQSRACQISMAVSMSNESIAS